MTVSHEMPVFCVYVTAGPELCAVIWDFCIFGAEWSFGCVAINVENYMTQSQMYLSCCKNACQIAWAWKPEYVGAIKYLIGLIPHTLWNLTDLRGRTLVHGRFIKPKVTSSYYMFIVDKEYMVVSCGESQEGVYPTEICLELPFKTLDGVRVMKL